MDLFAYSQIEKYRHFLDEQDISIPRLRGIRLMKSETKIPEIMIDDDNKEQYELFNKYVGEDVIYVHARIGGPNWYYYEGDKLTEHPDYLDRCDDACDCTYCDIYFRLKEKK